eukprot:gene2943-4953_t
MFFMQEDEGVDNSLMEFSEYEIELTGEGISNIPETLYKKQEVINLYLSSNCIKLLPQTFFEFMKNLKVIHLSYNKLTKIPQEICQLINLEVLLLDHNSIYEVSSGGLENCKKLKKLDLSFNNISILPQNEFSNLDNLQAIKLSDNPIESMNEKLSSVINSKELTDILKILEFNPNENKPEEILEHEINLDFLEEENYAVEVDLSEIPTIENSILMRYQKTMVKMEEEEQEESEEETKMILSRRRTRKPEKLKNLRALLKEDEEQRNKPIQTKEIEKEAQKKTKKMYDLLIEIDEKLISDLEKSDKLIFKRQERMKLGSNLLELVQYEEKKDSFFIQCEKILEKILRIEELLEDLKDTAVYPPGLGSMVDELKTNMENISSLVTIFSDEEDVDSKMNELNERASKVYSIFDDKPKFRRKKQKALVPSKNSIINTGTGSLILPQRSSLIQLSKPKKIRRSQIIESTPPKIEDQPDNSRIQISRRTKKTRILTATNSDLSMNPPQLSPSPIETKQDLSPVTPVEPDVSITASFETKTEDSVVEPKVETEVKISVEKTREPFKDISNEIVEETKKCDKKSIGNYGKTLRKRIRDDNDLAPYLTSNEKAEINFGIHELLDWMEEKSDATKEEIEQKRDEILKEAEETIKKATKKKLMDNRRKLKKRVEDDDDLGPYLTSDEKKIIDLTNQEFLDWMQENENATKEEIEAKRKEIYSRVEKMIKKAESKKKLNDIGRKTRKRMEDETDELSELNIDEKGRITLGVDSFLDWLSEHPNSEIIEMEKKEKEFLDILIPLENIAKSKKKLKDFGRNYKKRIDNDEDLGEYLSNEEKKRIDLATENFLNWMKDCDISNKEEIEKKKIEIFEETETLIKKAKTKKKLNDFGRKSRKRVEDEDDLGPYLTSDEKRRIDQGTEEFLNWMQENENATEEEIEAKRIEIFGEVEVIIKKAETKKKLKDFGRKMKRRIQNEEIEDDDLTPFLTKEEKRIIDLSTQEFLDWMAENPNATEEEIKMKRIEILGEAERILKLAAKKRIVEVGKKLKKRVEDDDLGEFLTELEKEKVNKNSDDLLDFIENIDLNDEKLTEDDLENKKKEFIEEAEKLIKKAESKKSLTDFGRKVKKRIQKEDDLTEIEIKNKKLIKMEVIDTLDWLADNEDATEIEIIEKDKEFRMKMENFSVEFEKKKEIDDFEESIEPIVHLKKKPDMFRNQKSSRPSSSSNDMSFMTSDPMSRRNMRASILNPNIKSNVQQKKMFYEMLSKKNKEDQVSYARKGSIMQVKKFQKVTSNQFLK